MRKSVIPIGIYYGNAKPHDLNMYLQDFINEINELIEHGLNVHNHTVFLDGTYFVCDAPAKNYIMGTVSHTGYNSCTRCTVRGITSNNRRIFIDLECPSRTCEDFLEWRDHDFRRRSTTLLILSTINIIHN